MIATINLWPYLITIYALTVLAGTALLALTMQKDRTERIEDGICLSLGATIGLAVAAVIVTFGAVLG